MELYVCHGNNATEGARIRYNGPLLSSGVPYMCNLNDKDSTQRGFHSCVVPLNFEPQLSDLNRPNEQLNHKTIFSNCPSGYRGSLQGIPPIWSPSLYPEYTVPRSFDSSASMLECGICISSTVEQRSQGMPLSIRDTEEPSHHQRYSPSGRSTSSGVHKARIEDLY